MASSFMFNPINTSTERPYLEDTSLPLSPTPAENYRCPVSTPANYSVQKNARIRRTKPLENTFSQPTTVGRRTPRSNMTPGRNLARARASAFPVKRPLKVGSSLEYYFVDSRGNQREAEQTNTGWLRALCAQPVEEILNKYRRKTDSRRTRVIWARTFTTPGERSLLNAWDSQRSVRGGRGQVVTSAVLDAGWKGKGQGGVGRDRLTRSEPPMSRTQGEAQVASPESMGSNSGRSGHPGGHALSDSEKSLPNGHTPYEPPSPRKAWGYLQEDGTASRVSSYTTQYYRAKGQARGPVYAKTISGRPEQLPQVNNRHKVSILLHQQAQAPPTARPPSGDDAGAVSSRSDCSPLPGAEEMTRVGSPTQVPSVSPVWE